MDNFFDFALPKPKIALAPLPDRLAAKLLDLSQNQITDRVVADLPELLPKGSLLVFNDTKVRSARLLAQKVDELRGLTVEVIPRNKTFEILIVRILKTSKNGRATGLVKPLKKWKIGEVVNIIGTSQLCQLIAKDEGTGESELEFLGLQDLEVFLERHGLAPLPPYILKHAPFRDAAKDRRDYQTIWAKDLGSVAAPTASFHFTPALLQRLREKFDFAYVTLHIGRGTFAPLTEIHFAQKKLYPESYSVPALAIEKIRQAKFEKRPVVAIGTTALRALESAADAILAQTSGSIRGETELFIQPGYVFKLTDYLMTNFHLPKSSLLLLVQAFGGSELLKKAYGHALERDYRFYSFGDFHVGKT